MNNDIQTDSDNGGWLRRSFRLQHQQLKFMKIRFKTKDNIVAVKECYDIEPPVGVVQSPMWTGAPTPAGNPKGFMEYRRYEFRGEIEDGIPTVHEA